MEDRIRDARDKILAEFDDDTKVMCASSLVAARGMSVGSTVSVCDEEWSQQPSRKHGKKYNAREADCIPSCGGGRSP